MSQQRGGCGHNGPPNCDFEDRHFAGNIRVAGRKPAIRDAIHCQRIESLVINCRSHSGEDRPFRNNTEK